MDELYLYILGLLEYCIVELFYIYFASMCVRARILGATCDYEIWEYVEFS
jgi:hypothetical protein